MCGREVVRFQWGTNGIFKYYLEKNDHLCGLVVRVTGNISRGMGSIPDATRFSEKGLKRGPLSLVSTTEELHGRTSSGSCLENRIHRADRKVGINFGRVHSRTQAPEFV
jgi:hypothetical protein